MRLRARVKAKGRHFEHSLSQSSVVELFEVFQEGANWELPNATLTTVYNIPQ